MQLLNLEVMSMLLPHTDHCNKVFSSAKCILAKIGLNACEISITNFWAIQRSFVNVVYTS